MIIVAGGDSFIFGSELADQTGARASMNTIPALLSKSIGAEYTCLAVPGNANNAIARQVMDYCETYKENKMFVFVMWTFVHRYDFRFNYSTGRKTSPWHSINLWDIVDDVATLKKEFANQNQNVFDELVNDRYRADSTGLSEFSKMFYKHVGNSEYYEFYTSLKEIVFLQNYLDINNIPFMFTFADIHFKDSDQIKRHLTDPSMRTLYNQIKWDHWYEFPAGTKKGETLDPRGFYQWAVENKYQVGTTHPLEQAHADAAQLMQEKFNEMVKKSL
jgi:hypothetical protein